MPNKGSRAKGTSEVAGIGIGSVIHHITVRRVIAAATDGLYSTPKEVKKK
jgi:hypothetical protein